MASKRVKILILSDFQIPDHNIKALNAIYSFIPYFCPDYLIINGDFLNFTEVSSYDKDPYYHVTLADEINEGRQILKKLTSLVRKYRKDAVIYLREGNHEFRIHKYLGRNADALAELQVKGERIVSLPHLFDLHENNIKYLGYRDDFELFNTKIVHGDVARKYSAYTAKAMFEKYYQSGVSGHTHRLGLYWITLRGESYFWIEGGCLCNTDSLYMTHGTANWQQGFTTLTYDAQKKQIYPQLVPIINGSFMYEGIMFG